MLVDLKSVILWLLILHYFCGKYVTITVEPNATLQPSEQGDNPFVVLRNSNFPNFREWTF
jgi:hypothetical protein